MNKYKKRGERRGICKLKKDQVLHMEEKERGRGAQHLEIFSFFGVLLAISLLDF
jgi:hypothetical protein